MKIFFGTNKTFDKENERHDGEVFITENLPDWLQEKHDRHTDAVANNVDRIKKPLYLIKWGVILGICSMIGRFLAKIVNETLESPLITVIVNLTVIAMLVVTVALVIVGICLVKRVLKGEESQMLEQQGELIQKECVEAFSVPDDVPEVEFFVFDYSNKNGKINIIKSNGCDALNMCFKTYVKDDALHIVEIPQKYGISLENIVSIKRINEKISFLFWNKETPHNKGEFEHYKIKYDKKDYIYSVNEYYSMLITYGGEEYSLYFPPYELPVIEKLTGLKAE